ncbi:MAG: Uncharacterised protein [Acidimicrobiales bacterium AG-410-I20]|nr:MAG: Uncharacterised protein [Acidimicrobiales bacterium AG-410-I20]
MAITLAIHFDPGNIHAAVDHDGRLDLIALGRGAAGMPMSIHLGLDDSVFFGHEANDQMENDPSGIVDDPIGSLFEQEITSQGGRSTTSETLLARLLAEVYAKSIQVLDKTPDQVLVVLTAGGPKEETYVAAAERALIGKVEFVSETKSWSAMATHGPSDLDPDLSGVVGGLLWKRHGDAPSGPAPRVTLEDLGQQETLTSSTLQPAPSVIAAGARSVFEEEATTAESKRRKVPRLLMVLLLIVGVAGAIGYVVIDQITGGEEDDSVLTPLTTTTSTTTTIPPTSTEAIEETSTTTSTSTTTTSTTTTTTTTTTTIPPLGMVTMSSAGLLLDGTGVPVLLAFDDLADEVLLEFDTKIGPSDSDTGWIEDPLCDFPMVRRVTYEDVEVVLVDEDIEDGTPGIDAVFGQWFVSGAWATESSIWTIERIGIGSTVAEMKETYSAFAIETAIDGDLTGYFSFDFVSILQDDGISGLTNATSDIGVVLSMWSGTTCDRRS